MDKVEKAFEIQRQARDNVKVLQNYMTDLQNWETEMKRKEAALNGQFEQDLPPVRSKIKKEKPVKVVKQVEKRISGHNYSAWEKFDAEKACEEVDMEGVGPASLDGKKSELVKKEKLREEALYEKERGNSFVKQEKWDEAISCYSRAIELVNDDAIYYANRGLCYLKKDRLQKAEADCSAALRLDPTYVKAFQRRAAAHERLGSLRAAAQDLRHVLALEPHNQHARSQLHSLTTRMGTKGTKSKSSPTITPSLEDKPLPGNANSHQPRIVELPTAEPATPKGKPARVEHPTALDKWRDGLGENITIIKPVKKPPHLRSKRPLKSIKIKEIQLGKTCPEQTATRMKIIEIENEANCHGDTNNNDAIIETQLTIDNAKLKGEGDCSVVSVMSDELQKEMCKEKLVHSDVNIEEMVAPLNSVQFMAEWKCLSGRDDARIKYLSLIDPARIPRIFAASLESGVLSEMLRVLRARTHVPGAYSAPISAYLAAFTRVQRFSALAMFLSKDDKLLVVELLDHCKREENCSEQLVRELKQKYEL